MKKKSTIKVISIMLVYLAFFSFKAGATTHIITVADFQFSPQNLVGVVVGDVIEWDWQAGSNDHTTTCDPGSQGAGNSLPPGAAIWNSPMDASTTTFQYTVTVAGTYNYYCIFHHAFGMVGSIVATPALPVKLTQFKVSNQNNNAILNWTTASEDNIDYFSVQKSKTGADFAEIGRVRAAGNSSDIRTYNYTDPNSSSADRYIYYNIAIVDKDGKKEFSPVELFKNALNTSRLIISLSPNPVNKSGHLMLKFNADNTSKMNVRVINMEGRTIMETTMQAYEGVNNGHLMLGDTPAGSYSVSFELNGIKEVHKLIVR